MKKVAVFILILFLVFPVMAKTERATLKVNQSVQFFGSNITVVNLSPLSDSVLFCINNNREIFVEDKNERYQNFTVRVTDISTKQVTFRVENIEKRNECGGNCRNEKCFFECKRDIDCDDSNNETLDSCVARNCRNSIIPVSEEVTEENTEITGESISEPKLETNKSDILPATIVLIVIVVLLGLIVFLRKN
nr:hypothetical protein [Candidatus Woesearchaeota archaeon]